MNHLHTSAYRLGMSVYVSKGDREFYSVVTGINEKVVAVLEGESFDPRFVKPVLRPITKITESEARHIYGLVKGERFSAKPAYQGGPRRHAINEINYEEYLDGINSSELKMALGDFRVIEYLEIMGIDIKGYLKDGYAMEFQNEIG